MQRWGEGCRNAAQLWREIRAKGYPGTSSPVSKLAARLRRQERAGRHPVPLPPAKQRLTVRQALLLFLRCPDDLRPAQQRVLDRLGTLDPAIAFCRWPGSAMVRISRADTEVGWRSPTI